MVVSALCPSSSKPLVAPRPVGGTAGKWTEVLGSSPSDVRVGLSPSLPCWDAQACVPALWTPAWCLLLPLPQALPLAPVLGAGS